MYLERAIVAFSVDVISHYISQETIKGDIFTSDKVMSVTVNFWLSSDEI